MKVFYQARNLEERAWDTNPDPNIAYEIHYLTPLPIGWHPADSGPATQPTPALPQVLARRGPGFLLLDPNTGSATPIPDPLSDREIGSTATLIVGDRVYWQGMTGPSHARLFHSTLSHLMPTAGRSTCRRAHCVTTGTN